LENDILTFWFEECEPKDWFKKDDAFDALLKDKFGALVEKALEGEMADWPKSLDGRLALILLADQFTRNIYRDTPKAFAGDDIALKLTLEALDEGLIEQYEGDKRQFMLTPLMHSESLDIQNRSIKAYEQYGSEQGLDYAHRHRDIIVRFGRYPHRNEILNRTSTTEEIEFLKGPNSSF